MRYLHVREPGIVSFLFQAPTPKKSFYLKSVMQKYRQFFITGDAVMTDVSCEVCGLSPEDGKDTFHVSPGIWRCASHYQTKLSDLFREVVRLKDENEDLKATLDRAQELFLE
jgi:hypothetical protein